jgi:hypothetical protein
MTQPLHADDLSTTEYMLAGALCRSGVHHPQLPVGSTVCGVCAELAAFAVVALADHLLPEGAETRTEWGVRLVWDDGRPDDIFPAADHADAVGRFRTHRRMRAQGDWLVTPHIVRREALSYASPWTASDAVRLAVGDESNDLKSSVVQPTQE